MKLSLRARVILGSVFWTIGLVLLTFTLMSWVFQHHPDIFPRSWTDENDSLP